MVPQKWLVYNGTSQSKMDDNWGYPHFRKPAYIYTYILYHLLGYHIQHSFLLKL